MTTDDIILRLADAVAEALDERNDVQRALEEERGRADEVRSDLEAVRHAMDLLSEAYCDLLEAVDFEAMDVGAAVLAAIPSDAHVVVDEVYAYSAVNRLDVVYHVVDDEGDEGDDGWDDPCPPPLWSRRTDGEVS